MSFIDEKWEILFDKYKIENRVKRDGLFYITADQIWEVKEPRLIMAIIILIVIIVYVILYK